MSTVINISNIRDESAEPSTVTYSNPVTTVISDPSPVIRRYNPCDCCEPCNSCEPCDHQCRCCVFRLLCICRNRCNCCRQEDDRHGCRHCERSNDGCQRNIGCCNRCQPDRCHHDDYLYNDSENTFCDCAFRRLNS